MTKPLFSLPFKRRTMVNESYQKGVSMVETLLVMPVIMLVGAGILHLALVAQAKSNLEYASLMAARIASSTPNFGLDGTLLEDEVIDRMKASDPRNDEYRDRMEIVRVCILRPDISAFQDFGQDNLVAGSTAIPNDNLPFLSKDQGRQSGITVQDANLLHLRVVYRFDSNVPFMNSFRLDGSDDGTLGEHVASRYEEVGELSRGTYGIWLQSDAVVVMQTPALLNSITESHIQGTASFRQCPPP